MLMKKIPAMIAGIALLILGLSSPAWALDGAALYQKTCVACHGADPNAPTMPIAPKIAGQNEEYLVNQMKDIKSGARQGGMVAMMMPIMIPVTEEQIVAIAKWVATQ